MLVGCPWPNWERVPLVMHVDKSGILHQSFKQWARARLHACISSCFDKACVDLHHRAIAGYGVIGRVPFEVEIDHLCVSARLGKSAISDWYVPADMKHLV